jgi:hypothetical protein
MSAEIIINVFIHNESWSSFNGGSSISEASNQFIEIEMMCLRHNEDVMKGNHLSYYQKIGHI